MERKSFAEMHCSIAQCLEIVGEWWSMLIVRDALLGVCNFDQFQRRLGISRNILALRLSRLVEAGVMTKVLYSERPPRFEYRLTEKGRDLWPIVTAMRQWGDRYAAPGGPPLVLRHTECGRMSEPVFTCSNCGGKVDAEVMDALPGPGAVEPLVGRWQPA